VVVHCKLQRCEKRMRRKVVRKVTSRITRISLREQSVNKSVSQSFIHSVVMTSVIQFQRSAARASNGRAQSITPILCFSSKFRIHISPPNIEKKEEIKIAYLDNLNHPTIFKISNIKPCRRPPPHRRRRQESPPYITS
jgi:hypothetical protein